MKCDRFLNERPSLGAAALMLALAVGIFGSYVPQAVAIFRRRTTEGISPYFLLLMALGSLGAFSNIMLLSRPLISCCSSHKLGFGTCAGSLLPAAQLFAGLAGPLMLVSLSVYFSNGSRAIRASGAVVLGAIVLLLALSAVAVRTEHETALATGCGLAALLVGLVQYLPQLYTTYTLKHVGSLSITTMLVQVPGGLVFAGCLMLHSSWSTWISILSAALFQLTLLLMALHYQNTQPVNELGSEPTYGSI